MNNVNPLRRSLRHLVLVLFSIFIIQAAQSQDIGVQLSATNLTPFSDGARSVAKPLRQTTNGVAYAVSYTVLGNRVMATVTMSSDFTQPSELNSASLQIPPLPPGNYTYEVVERGSRVPERRSAQVAFTVQAPEVSPISATVLYERQLKKFYVTASQQEVTLLLGLNASANTNWSMVDDNIRVWTAPQPFTTPVCRLFFGSLSRHFFSADDYNECRVVRGLSGVIDEGVAFHAIPPLRPNYADGIGAPPPTFLNLCPIGTDPVHRVFNDVPGEVGHRYTSSASTVRSSYDQFGGSLPGFKLEGIAFCSPR
jgi:hypothetical protein